MSENALASQAWHSPGEGPPDGRLEEPPADALTLALVRDRERHLLRAVRTGRLKAEVPHDRAIGRTAQGHRDEAFGVLVIGTAEACGRCRARASEAKETTAAAFGRQAVVEAHDGRTIIRTHPADRDR